MGEIAAALADLVILTSDNPRTEDPEAILDQVAAAFPRLHRLGPGSRTGGRHPAGPVHGTGGGRDPAGGQGP